MKNLTDVVEYSDEMVVYYERKVKTSEEKIGGILAKHGLSGKNHTSIDSIVKALRSGLLSEDETVDVVLKYSMLRKFEGKMSAYADVVDEIKG